MAQVLIPGIWEKLKSFQNEVGIGVEERGCRRKSAVLGRGICSAGRVWCFQGDAQSPCAQSNQHTLTAK